MSWVDVISFLGAILTVLSVLPALISIWRNIFKSSVLEIGNFPQDPRIRVLKIYRESLDQRDWNIGIRNFINRWIFIYIFLIVIYVIFSIFLVFNYLIYITQRTFFIDETFFVISLTFALLFVLPILYIRLNYYIRLKRNVGGNAFRSRFLFFNKALVIVEAQQEVIFKKIYISLKFMNAKAINLDYSRNFLEAHLGSEDKYNVIKIKITHQVNKCYLLEITYDTPKYNFERGSTSINNLLIALTTNIYKEDINPISEETFVEKKHSRLTHIFRKK